jgi:endonuclease III
VNLRLGGEFGEAVLRYHDGLIAAGLDGSVADTIKQLVMATLSTQTEGVTVSAAAQRSFTRYSTWFIKEARDFTLDMKAKLEELLQQPTGVEKCPHCGMDIDAPVSTDATDLGIPRVG